MTTTSAVLVLADDLHPFAARRRRSVLAMLALFEAAASSGAPALPPDCAIRALHGLAAYPVRQCVPLPPHRYRSCMPQSWESTLPESLISDLTVAFHNSAVVTRGPRGKEWVVPFRAARRLLEVGYRVDFTQRYEDDDTIAELADMRHADDDASLPSFLTMTSLVLPVAPDDEDEFLSACRAADPDDTGRLPEELVIRLLIHHFQATPQEMDEVMSDPEVRAEVVLPEGVDYVTLLRVLMSK